MVGFINYWGKPFNFRFMIVILDYRLLTQNYYTLSLLLIIFNNSCWCSKRFAFNFFLHFFDLLIIRTLSLIEEWILVLLLYLRNILLIYCITSCLRGCLFFLAYLLELLVSFILLPMLSWLVFSTLGFSPSLWSWLVFLWLLLFLNDLQRLCLLLL